MKGRDNKNGCADVITDMRFYKTILCVLAATVLALSSCSKFDGDQAVPAYISIDAMVIDRSSNDPQWSHKDNGFYSNLIDAAEIVLYVEGDTAETTVGVFQLPCKVPVLKQGDIKYVRISPVVRQNGIAATRIYYPYYNYVTYEHVRLTPDSVTSFDTIHTTYKSSNTVKVVWEEYFNNPSSLRLDSVVRPLFHNDTVLTGNGCGVVRFQSDQATVNFWADTTFTVTDKSAYLYLEMDYRTDCEFSVGFNNPMLAGGTSYIYSAMTLYRNDHWQKIYINLGKLWTYYNHYPDIRLYFTLLNGDHQSGSLYLDNMKVVVM